MAEFNKGTFAELLVRARGDRSINQYALHSKVDAGYISRLSRCLIDTAPSPDVIRRLATKAHGGVTFEDLMAAAGHIDPDPSDQRRPAEADPIDAEFEALMNDPEARIILRATKNLPRHAKKSVIDYIEFMKKKFEEEENKRDRE